MTTNPAIAHIGERLREARLNTRLTVREAAMEAGLRGHGTLVQYENGHVLPPLNRLATLAQVYDVSLASLVVSNNALAPVVTVLERASTEQISAFTRLIEEAAEIDAGGAA